jgi:hypothetical protein
MRDSIDRGQMLFLAWSPFLEGMGDQMAQGLLHEALQMYAPCREGVTTMGDLAAEIARSHPSVDFFEAMKFVEAFFRCLLEGVGEGGGEMSMNPDGFMLTGRRASQE